MKSKLNWQDCSTHPKCNVSINDGQTEYGAFLRKGMRAKSAAKDYAESYDFNMDADEAKMHFVECTLTDYRTGNRYHFQFSVGGSDFRWDTNQMKG